MSEGSIMRRRVLRVRRGLPSITVSLLLILALFAGLDLSFDIIPNVSSGLIEVDDSGGKDHLTIQAGVDAAFPGDTVFVYAGIYNEDVTITKTINLTGEDRDTTIINSTNLMGIYVSNADFVNISGFTVVNGSWAGIRLMPSNNSIIENNIINNNDDGIEIINSNNTIIKYNIVTNSFGGGNGIYLDSCSNFTILNNTCIYNKYAGIQIRDTSANNYLEGNNFSNNEHGIIIREQSNNNIISNNVIDSNTAPTLGPAGIYLYDSYLNSIYNNSISNNKYGINFNDITISSLPNRIFNCTIRDSLEKDIRIRNSHVTLLNVSFNKSKVHYRDTVSTLKVKWYLHINVIDYLGNPVPSVNIKIEDNINGTYNETINTNVNGYLRWLQITEYIEQDINDDSIGEKIKYTPHKIRAWNNTLIGYAYPDPIIDESKTINIILYNGTFLVLKPGWNLVSLPRIQTDSNLKTVLKSIKGQYNAVQWYNITDSNDHWKHYHVSKPTNMNDFNEINHTIGFWIYINDPQGTTLMIIGDELFSDQNIFLYPGWNLIGYPSKSDKLRDDALDNINFNSEVDAIYTYNSTTQKWKEIGITDYFIIGQGYWIHSKVSKMWNVPL
jgi:parallel beta-helix repeat protein